MMSKETESRTDFLIKAYEDEMIARADYLLSLKEDKNLPDNHPSFGILAVFSSREQLKKTMSEAHLDWTYAGNQNELADSAEDILTRDLGYSYDTLQDARREYEKCRTAAENAEQSYKNAQKRLHRLKTSLKNTQLQNQWLARENSSHDEKKKAAGKETEELTVRMQQLHPQMESLQEETDTQEADLIPLMERNKELKEQLSSLEAEAEKKKANLKFYDRILHPSRYKNEKQEILGLTERITSVQEEMQKVMVKAKEEDHKLEETRTRLKQVNEEYAGLEKKKKESAYELEKHSSDLEGGTRMIDEGQARLKQVQARIHNEEGRLDGLLSDALKKRNLQFESAMVLVHTWIGWAEDYRSDLSKITMINECREEVPADLIEKEFFAPFIFVASDAVPMWLQNMHLGTLIIDYSVSDNIRKCFRKIK